MRRYITDGKHLLVGNGNIMLKVHTLFLMEEILRENGRMENLGTEQFTTKTET